MELNKIYQGDVREVLKSFPDESVNCIVTSPPYWALRDYGTSVWKGGDEDCNHSSAANVISDATSSSTLQGSKMRQIENHRQRKEFRGFCPKCGAEKYDDQIGQEETPDLFVQALVDVFRECKRVLKGDGTLWLNLGDTYWGGKGKSGASWDTTNNLDKINAKATNFWEPGSIRPNDRKHEEIKPKDMVGIPWMVAFALRADGWYLRQDIIWHKPNPMPESVRDRCTKSHEYIFLLSKSPKYYFDQESIRVPLADESIARIAQDIEKQQGSDRVPGKINGNMKAVVAGEKANKKSVWSVTTKPFNEAHFATFPPDLITDCILAGCPAGGVVLDPFLGAGTTAIVSGKLNRNYIGVELNPEYIKIGEKRINKELGMFAKTVKQ